MSSPLASSTSYSREGVATTLAVDLFEFGVVGGFLGRLAGLWISQSSDVGDAAEEMLRWRLVWGNTASGSGGAAPDSWNSGYAKGDPPITAAESFNTTAASGGTPQSGPANAFNIRAGEQMWFPPGCEPTLGGDDGGGEVNVIRLMAAPADSLTMTAVAYVYHEVNL